MNVSVGIALVSDWMSQLTCLTMEMEDSNLFFYFDCVAVIVSCGDDENDEAYRITSCVLMTVKIFIGWSSCYWIREGYPMWRVCFVMSWIMKMCSTSLQNNDLSGEADVE